MKEDYISPTLTVVSFAVERGFEASGGIGDPRNLLFGLFDDDEQDYDQASSFGEEYWSW